MYFILIKGEECMCTYQGELVMQVGDNEHLSLSAGYSR